MTETVRKTASIIHSLALFLILFLASISLYLGWRLFWFLTDDAYIAFRYVSNSVLGYGYTWNLPPFRPVEGYTSFLWVVLLDVVWRVTGAEPPDAANNISLLFAFGTTLLGVAMLLKMELKGQLQRIRLPLLAMVLLGVLTNRTYLTWTSSGLETAMFNFFVTAWVFSCLFIRPNTLPWLSLIAITAVLTTLTRPDGLLLIAAALFLGTLSLASQVRGGRFRPHYLLALTPFLVTAAHFVWRKHNYGEWLPNTLTAKFVAPWPESGLRYLLSFIIEYALWFWAVVVLLFLFSRMRHLLQLHRLQQLQMWLRDLTPTRSLIVLVVSGTLAAHFAYYTFIIGGDYLEYRVYSHLVLFIFLSSVWLLNALNVTTFRTLAFLGVFILCAAPVQWTHWMSTHDLPSSPEALTQPVPIAHKLPVLVRPYMDLYDRLQSWLVQHYVGCRHKQHKIFLEFQTRTYPPRAMGMLLQPDDYPVMVAGAVGVPSWMLPTTNIIDAHGLNDRVVARNPVAPNRFRLMAHERYLPAGYAECFRPNVKTVTSNKVVVAERDLTADTIVDCENGEWPPSVGDEYSAGNLGIDNIKAPAVDSYLWHVWSPDLLYLYYVPPQQDSTHPNLMLLDAFQDYTGLGCVVVPPAEELVSRADYLFAFLHFADRPSLQELAAPFPWTRIHKENGGGQLRPYHLGYAALAGLEVQPQPSQALTAVWVNQLSLLGYDLTRTVYQPGETIYLTMYFHPRAPLQAGYSVFTHLLSTPNPSSAGRLWGQDDGDPCRGLYPMDRWQPGSIVIGKMAIAIPLEAPSGDYEVVVGFYNWQTGERMPLSGEISGDESLILDRIQISAPQQTRGEEF